MNRYILIIIILITCILLTGCWSYREINSIYIVAGIAVIAVAVGTFAFIKSRKYNV